MDTAPEIFLTQDGSHSLVAGRYGVSYHSRYGAVRESLHVFIQAGLRFISSGKEGKISVLEVGFGTGLNAFLTYLEAEKNGTAIYYEGIEAHPLPADFACQLNYPEALGVPQAVEAYQSLHESSWNQTAVLGNFFQYNKQNIQIEHFRAENAFDVIYYDAFSPGAQPELWTGEVLSIYSKALQPGGVLVTYCAKGEVKRRLRELGLHLETLPGPPGKREMVRAMKI